MKKTKRRAASLTALLALLLSGLVPMTAFADEEPIGPAGSFGASDNASPTIVCEALGAALELGALDAAERVNWPPEETTASTDGLDGFTYIVLKSGQVYEYFSFPVGYNGELLKNGTDTKFSISNITGCIFQEEPADPESPVLDLALLKVWDVPEDLDVDLSGVASLTVDGVLVDSPVVVEAGETYTLAESVDGDALSGLLPEACVWDEAATSATVNGAPFDFPGDLIVPTDETDDTTFQLQVTNAITCEDPEEPADPESPVLDLALVKVWDVPEDLDVDLSGVASLTVDGVLVDSPVVVEAGETYTLAESVDGDALSGLLPEACVWDEAATSATVNGAPFDFPGDLTVPTDETDDTTYVLEVTNVVTCADVGGVQITTPDPDPEPQDGPVEDPIVEMTVEVAGVTQTAAALPETGVPAIALALLGLLSMGLGGGMLAGRRRV